MAEQGPVLSRRREGASTRLPRTLRFAGLLAIVVVGSGCLIPNGQGSHGFAQPAPAARQDLAITYGTQRAQKLDLFRPKGRGPFPVIVWVHGGGWRSGDRKQIANFVRRQWSRGYAVASIDYHLSTPTKASFLPAVRDVKTAVRWVKTHAAEYGLRGDKIILAGVSSGGYLAAFAGVTAGVMEPTCLTLDAAAQDSTVAGVANFVGPADLRAFVNDTSDGQARCLARELTRQFLGCPPPARARPCDPTDRTPWRLCDSSALRDASITTWIDSNDPPAYLGYRGNDALVQARLHGLRQHNLWVAAKGSGFAAWYDLRETVANGLHGAGGVNIAYWDGFLDSVAHGTVR
jgi:acetyl esterase/lipase